MKFQPKTDWKYNDTPTEADFNRIEQGIADALEGNDPIIQQETPPDGIKEGRLWLDTSDDTYQGTVFESLRGEIGAHLADKANPHGVTKSQVGLGNVDNVKQIPLSEKGQPNGVAALDADGNVLNGNREISGGGIQTGVFTDTTTVIPGGGTYTKRIPLKGKPTRGKLEMWFSTTMPYPIMYQVYFTDVQGKAIGGNFYGSSGVTGQSGYSGGPAGVWGYGSGGYLGSGNTGLLLMDVWIDRVTNELVLVFKSSNASSPLTLSITDLPTMGTYGRTGLIWEVY